MALTDSQKEIVKQALYKVDRDAYLRSLKGNIVPMEWQTFTLNNHDNFKIINGARQSGKSTIVSVIPAHTAKYYPGSLSIILAPTKQQSKLDMEKLKGYIALDRGYPKVLHNNDSEIVLENGSMIKVVTATDDSARGYSDPKVVILDESSRISNAVYATGVLPMLTGVGQSKAEVILISTPKGQRGFFFTSWSRDKSFTKILVRSPFDPTEDGMDLVPHDKTPEELMEEGKREGIAYSCYSPRHMDYNRQLRILLGQDTDEESDEDLAGRNAYLQEMCCQFVETQAQVFSYEDIRRAFDQGKFVKGLDGDGFPASATASVSKAVGQDLDLSELDAIRERF